MMKRTFLFALTAFALSIESQAAPQSLTLDASAAYTTNANLVDTGADSDAILRAGGTWRFPLAQTDGRFALHYSDYIDHSENDLVAVDFGSSWKAAGGKPGSSQIFDLRLTGRNYVRNDVGTTDQSFTHYGVIGSTTLSMGGTPSLWTYTPQADVQYYPGLDRTDFDFSLRLEYDSLVGDIEKGFIYSATPGLLYSTSGDFSKAYLALAVDYEAPIDAVSTWGAGLGLKPSYYLNRETTSTVLTTSRGRRGTTTTGTSTVTEKESTLLISPSAWYTRKLSRDWRTNFEVFGNFQSSKSETYNFKEIQLLASLRYAAF
jgi:hypothetical protein